MKISINYPITLFPQPTNMSCWSAAATMLFGDRSVGPGRARLDSSGGLPPQSVPDFARSQGLQMYYPQTWTVQGLADRLRSGPLMVLGHVPNGHAYVIGGMVSDGTPAGTILTIYDPWPPGKGNVGQIPYATLIKKYPMATDYILQR